MSLKEYYSPLSFLQSISRDDNERIVNSTIANSETFVDQDCGAIFFYNILDWDSEYFGFVTAKLMFVDHSQLTDVQLNGSLKACIKYLREVKMVRYCFLEVPSEDIRLMQALCLGQFLMVETRTHFFNNSIQDYSSEKRYTTRLANSTDIKNLSMVASEMRNEFDRFHADPMFSSEQADGFLATYIEQAIKGYSDIVLVPDEEGVFADSFIAADVVSNKLQINHYDIARVVLSAVSSNTNKGWFEKLVSELLFLLKLRGIEVLYYTTQSTNRPVFHVLNKLGFRLGRVTHTFSKNLR
jgi:dTDP-4-amino-4,6-dideoxy-D-galactose acyltransferase